MSNFLIGWRRGNPAFYQSVQVRTSGSVRAVWQSGQSSRSMSVDGTCIRLGPLLVSFASLALLSHGCRGLSNAVGSPHEAVADFVIVMESERQPWPLPMECLFQDDRCARLLGFIHMFSSQGKVFVAICDNFVSLRLVPIPGSHGRTIPEVYNHER